MIMLFDFEGDEVVTILELISERVQVLKKQPPSFKRDEELYALQRFTEKMGPVIEEGMIQETRQLKALMN